VPLMILPRAAPAIPALHRLRQIANLVPCIQKSTALVTMKLGIIV
jgi:hypothetical protein